MNSVFEAMQDNPTLSGAALVALTLAVILGGALFSAHDVREALRHQLDYDPDAD
jgi:hypothetical protein